MIDSQAKISRISIPSVTNEIPWRKAQPKAANRWRQPVVGFRVLVLPLITDGILESIFNAFSAFSVERGYQTAIRWI
jgi:hypothetical protein